MQKVISKSKATMFLFNSVTELTDYTDESLFEGVVGSASFVGQKFDDWSDVEERSSTAWAEGLMILEAFIERLRKVEIPDLKSRKRKTHFDAAEGDEIEIEKMYAGEAFWRKTEREQQAGSTELTVIIDTSTPASVSTDDILWRGAAAIALTQILEEKGYQVEVLMIHGNYLFANDVNPVVTACRLKAPSDPLDTSSLVNAVAGWFYRSACFTLMMTHCKNEKQQAAYGLGRSYSPNAKDIDEITPDDSRIYASNVFTFNGAADLMINELTKLAQDPNKQAN
jgi:hypothetical protein